MWLIKKIIYLVEDSIKKVNEKNSIVGSVKCLIKMKNGEEAKCLPTDCSSPGFFPKK
mgnify:CR=1 FL=1